MGKKLILLLGVVVALGLGVAFWLYKPEAPEPEPVVVAPPPPPPAAVTPPPQRKRGLVRIFTISAPISAPISAFKTQFHRPGRLKADRLLGHVIPAQAGIQRWSVHWIPGQARNQVALGHDEVDESVRLEQPKGSE